MRAGGGWSGADRELDEPVGGAGEVDVSGEKLGAELLGECEVARVSGTGSVTQLPDPSVQRAVAVTQECKLPEL